MRNITFIRKQAEFVRDLPKMPAVRDKARQLPTAISVPLQPLKPLAEVPQGLDFHSGLPDSQPLAPFGITASSPHTKKWGEEKGAGQSWLHRPKQYKLQPDSHSLFISYRFLNLSNVFIHTGAVCKWLQNPHLSKATGIHHQKKAVKPASKRLSLRHKNFFMVHSLTHQKWKHI